MVNYCFAGIFLLLYIYYIFQIVAITKGKIKNVVAVCLCADLAVGAEFLGMAYIGYFFVMLLLFLFVVFYGEEPMIGNRIRVALPGIFLIFYGMVMTVVQYEKFNVSIVQFTDSVAQIRMFFLGVFCLLLFFLLSQKRGYLNGKNILCISLLTFGILFIQASVYFKCGMILVLFFLLESTLREYQMGYESNTRDMQNRLMQQQYEEIKSVYLNLRGWRHDYHNHIQVMKAFLDSAQVDECRSYLNEIETELNRVDSFVRSGNLMADAILNSKITRAVEKGIRVNCDAALEEELFLSDMDLCIILGNVLDNAIESCEKIEVEKRFLRIYIAMVKEQLYISVQNAAPEILNFEERNYISTKRGNHGLGMKRVAAVVEKREGFLNLNNEAGIFGTEIMIPKL